LQRRRPIGIYLTLSFAFLLPKKQDFLSSLSFIAQNLSICLSFMFFLPAEPVDPAKALFRHRCTGVMLLFILCIALSLLLSG
jgi:hypothetical protein